MRRIIATIVIGLGLFGAASTAPAALFHASAHASPYTYFHG